MKNKFLTTMFLLLAATSSIFAADNYPFSIGASISTKFGVNAAAVPDGTQNALLFLRGADFALSGYMPMSEDSKTGLFLELGYTNLPFGLKQTGFNEVYEVNTKFFTISPVLLMSGFTIGADFGFALSTNYNYLIEYAPMDNDINVNLRVGGMIPLYQNKIGALNFIIHATYSITGMQYGYSDHTYHPSAISLGLNYLLNIEDW